MRRLVSRSRRTIVGAATLGGLLLALAGPAPAQEEAPLKAAIVLNLLQFVQWPDEADWPAEAPIVLCADRHGPLWPHLAALAGRVARGHRTLQLREAAGGPDALRGCQAWLTEPTSLSRRPAGTPGVPLLVIADIGLGDDAPAVVALRRVQGRIGFDVDLAAARRAGLQISSKLLRLAGKVRE